MNGNSNSLYPGKMFKFIHHPKYGCGDFQELRNIRTYFVYHNVLKAYNQKVMTYFFLKNYHLQRKVVIYISNIIKIIQKVSKYF
jgi:hypothetical protein